MNAQFNSITDIRTWIADYIGADCSAEQMDAGVATARDMITYGESYDDEQAREIIDAACNAAWSHKSKSESATQAQKIADLFGNDGQRWARDGKQLVDVCREAGGEYSRDADNRKFTFRDGSSIIACDSGWDLGYVGEDCFCWAGNPHHCEKE